MTKFCRSCVMHGMYTPVDPRRVLAGFDTCLPCGERVAKAKKWCTATLHKSNTIVITDYEDLKGINNKGGFYR